ncbi:MAG: LytTR family DNA-binding domain-containing protein [Flavobacterium sp.]|nr:LytTR family DNA-binding domain-containing protein [Flavobacterium sp.]
MKHTFIIVDDQPESIENVMAIASHFQQLVFLGSATNYSEAVNVILEHTPQLVFLEIAPEDKKSNLSLQLINELHRYLRIVPEIIVITKTQNLAYEAMKYEVLDYLLKPIDVNELRKTILKYEKFVFDNPRLFTQPKTSRTAIEVVEPEIISSPPATESLDSQNTASAKIIEAIPGLSLAQEKPLIICVKSYGDYRFIEARDICYLQADNNSTDIHLNTGEMITAFKTLKHFESVLTNPFVRIHNSYIVNVDYVSRIHTGNSVCYIKNTTTKLPFSKSYKENIDGIIAAITNGNYLEI